MPIADADAEPEFEIVEAPLPKSIDSIDPAAGDTDPAAAGFVAATEIRNAVLRDSLGISDFDVEPAEMLSWMSDEHEPRRVFLARIAATPVGWAQYSASIDASVTECHCEIFVLPEFRRRGIASALLARIIAIAVSTGRSAIVGDFISPIATEGKSLDSPTGFGSVGADAPGTTFALSNGFSLGQVMRISRLELPVNGDFLASLRESAQESAGDDYRVVRWVGPTPPQWRADVALIVTKMSTDAPNGEVEVSENVWDEDRVAAMDERRAAGPMKTITVGVEHIPSGKLVGHTELLVPPRLDRPVVQTITLVLSEHRGHRLGMLLKISNLLYLEEVFPGHPAIGTFNAEENRYMLSVNETVGFVPIGVNAVWMRSLR